MDLSEPFDTVTHTIFLSTIRLRPMQVGVDFRIRFNSELYELLNNIDVVQRINFQRLRWLGHVEMVDAPATRVFIAGICGSR